MKKVVDDVDSVDDGVILDAATAAAEDEKYDDDCSCCWR